MKNNQFETKLELFIINHYDGISNTLAVVFLAGFAIILVFGTPAILCSFTALLIGFAIAMMVLVGAPDRRRMKAWKASEKQRNTNDTVNKALVLSK